MNSALRPSRWLVWLLYTGVAGALISLAAVLSAHGWVFDLLAHFRVHYLVLIALLFMLALFLRRWRLTYVLAFCLAVHLQAVLRALMPLGTATELSVDAEPLRLMSSNLLYWNDNADAVLEELRAVQPDVLVLVEYSDAWRALLAETLDGYAYRLEAVTGTPFGIALFSRFPIVSSREHALVSEEYPSLEAELDLGGRPLRVVATHPVPPLFPTWYRWRNAQFEGLATVLAEGKQPSVLIGDLNSTPWSAHFRELESKSGLRDARRGIGIKPTWPALPGIGIPIDHLLVSETVAVLGLQTGSGAGSDHRAVWADLQVGGR